MKILFLSYWGATEGLTAATVIPHLKILKELPEVERIIFCSIERGGTSVEVSLPDDVTHFQLLSYPQASVLKTKMMDFQDFPKQLSSICREHRIDLMICRTSLAGALGYLVSRKTNIPYVVESFEPHAAYMVESGVWKWYDPRNLIQLFFETRIKATASFILPVSANYEKKLVTEGVAKDRIVLQPCCIDLKKFSFDEEQRISQRKAYGIADDAVVGIYVGKFGGIYYDDEAFALYRQAFLFFGEQFWLIILSGDHREHIMQQLERYKLPIDRVIVKYATHEEVPSFLSAADFAFSTIKPAPSRIYCSPIKDGEFWANGLPILLEPGIGDDSSIVEGDGGGVILDMKQPSLAFGILAEKYLRDRKTCALAISRIATRYRRMELIVKGYESVLARFRKG